MLHGNAGLLFHNTLDQVHGHMSRPFDNRLRIMLPGNAGQFAQGAQFAELGLVIRICNTTGAQPVTDES